MSEHTLVNMEQVGRVCVLTLNNAPANCYSYEMMKCLDDRILEARFNEDVDVILLTGAGEKFFCAGADIETLKTVTPEYKYHFCQHANETLSRLEATPKLVIVAINGHCVGGGLEVALAADLRVAKEGTYKLGLPEVKLGVLAGTGGTQRTARALGKSKAIELLATGRMFGPDEALELGLVNHLLPSDNFREAACAYAAQFTSPGTSAHAIGLMKRSVQTGAEVDLQSGLALERELQQRLFTGPDAKEGMTAFSEKRAPAFGKSTETS